MIKHCIFAMEIIVGVESARCGGAEPRLRIGADGAFVEEADRANDGRRVSEARYRQALARRAPASSLSRRLPICKAYWRANSAPRKKICAE